MVNFFPKLRIITNLEIHPTKSEMKISSIEKFPLIKVFMKYIIKFTNTKTYLRSLCKCPLSLNQEGDPDILKRIFFFSS